MVTTPVPDLNPSTKLAIDRTRLAHERTLMAWVRTATSLISFGFTIYKFFQYLREEQTVVRTGLVGPREFALMMIGVGVAALVVATFGHRRSMKALSAEYGVPTSSTLSVTVSALVGGLGALLFLLTLFRQ